MQRILWVLLLSPLIACDDGGEETTTPEPDVMLRVDAEIDAQVSTPDTTVTPDIGGDEEDAIVDAALPEDAGLRPIEGCEDVCDLYEECGALEGTWPEGREACMTACEGGMQAQSWPTYVGCLQLRGCARIDECAMPVRPLVTCEEICPVMDACAGGEPIPFIEDCATTCADTGINYTFRTCAAPLLVEEDCDLTTFAECVLADQAPECHQGCANRAACDEGIDVVTCGLDCLEGLSSADGLSARRARLTRDCFANHPECEDQVLCDARTSCGFDADAFCGEDACGFFGEGCGEGPLCLQPPETTECLANLEGCAEPWRCLNPPMEPPEFCTEFCLYQVLCEELPEGVSEFDCVESCRASLTEGGAERGLLEGYFSCTSVDTCEEFSACFGDQATEARCGRYCEARAGCDLEDNEACLEDCAARFSTTRAQIQVGCSEWMGTCEGQAACQLPEPPACERICDPLDCVDPVDCVRACDDGDLEDPDSFLRQLSCVASLAQCHTAAACLEGALEPGEACLTYCALEEKCGDDAEDRADCLLRCGHGGSGEADLALEAALLCAEGLTSESTCDAFNACLAPEPDAGCARLCEVTEGCGFAIDGCLESCPDSVDAGDIACVLNAERREGGCRAVAACLDIELPPPDPSCGALCARRAECDPSVDTFLCELDCEAGAETDSRAACAELASCERMPRCTDEPLPDSEVCAGFCDGSAFTPPAAECGAFEDPADCVPACVGRVLLYGQDVTTNLTLCTGFSECTPDAYQLCLDWMGSPCQAQVTQEMCMADRIDEHLAWGCERFLTAQQLACIRALPPGDPIGCDATACYLGF